MSRRKSWVIVNVILYFISCGLLQEVFGQAHDSQLWLSGILDYNFSSSWLVELELDYYQLIDGGEKWRQYATQPSIEYYPNNTFDLFAGVYLSNTEQNKTVDTKEIRPLIGVRWNIIKPEKRVFLRAQVKYEHRFFTSSPDNKEDAGRMRKRLDLFIPITKTSYNMDKDLYAIILSEIYTNFENSFKERFQATFRQYLGLGYRFSYSWRLEMDYVVQASRDSVNDDNADTISNVLFITLKYFIRRKSN